MHKCKILIYRGERIRIDREIAPLISKMWKLGINTTNCCQAHCLTSCKHTDTNSCKQYMWLCFETAVDAEKFYNFVAVYEKDNSESMYDKIGVFPTIGDRGAPPDSDRWRMEVYTQNLGIHLHEERVVINEAEKKYFPRHHKTYGVLVEDYCKKNNFIFMPQLFIPRKHLSYLEERLDLALVKKRKRS